MRLKQLAINQYKNNEDSLLDFNERVNIFVGDNGAGKTNILDAIYYLSFCKSPFGTLDGQNIKRDADYFMLRGEYSNNELGNEKVHISYKNNERKKVKRNDKEYEKLADHIGEFPLVIISPYDSYIINGQSEDRRKYIDSVISQFDRAYLEQLMQYNTMLTQRNALLKQSNFHKPDLTLFEVMDLKMAKIGTQIHQKRKEFLAEFIPVIQNFYQFISMDLEVAGISYKSQLHENDYFENLQSQLNKDLVLKHTSVGIHRDDIEFELDGYPIRRNGSQGQQKSFVVALKIAQFEYTFLKKKYKPILLLDDIFDKLDIHRVQQLMKLVSRNEFGQIFITDTNYERISKIFENIDVSKQIFRVEAGTVKNIEGNGIKS